MLKKPSPIDLSARFQRLFLRHQPLSYAVMQPAGAADKYLKQVQPHPPGTPAIPIPLTDEDIDAHLRGGFTIAAPLIGAGDLAYCAAADVDEGGEIRLWALLEAARRRGVTAFAVACRGASGHDGGHVWALFEEAADPQRLKKLMQELVLVASRELASQGGQDPATTRPITAEIWPAYKPLRLPLGIHTWTQSRGRLLLQSGQVINLDAEARPVEVALEALERLPLNSTSLLPTIEPPQPQRPAERGQLALNGQGDITHEYNRTHSLLSLLESYGAERADILPHGGYLLHCPCGQHPHGDRRPSLELKPSTRPDKYGQFIALGYSPVCAFKTEHRQVIDAFSVYCYFEHMSLQEGAIHLRELADQADHRDPNAQLLDQAEADERLQPCARQVLKALVSYAEGKPWCRPSIARLASMMGVQAERTVQRGLVQLEGRYIRTEPQTQGTWVRHFLIPQAEPNDNLGTESNGTEDLHKAGSPGDRNAAQMALRSPKHGPCESKPDPCEIRPCKPPRLPSEPPPLPARAIGLVRPVAGATEQDHNAEEDTPTIHSKMGHIEEGQSGVPISNGENCTLSRGLPETWAVALQHLRGQMVQADYAHLKNSQLLALDGSLAIIGVPTVQNKEAIENRFVGPARRILSNLYGRPLMLRIVLASCAARPAAAETSQPKPSDAVTKCSEGDVAGAEDRIDENPYGPNRQNPYRGPAATAEDLVRAGVAIAKQDDPGPAADQQLGLLGEAAPDSSQAGPPYHGPWAGGSPAPSALQLVVDDNAAAPAAPEVAPARSPTQAQSNPTARPADTRSAEPTGAGAASPAPGRRRLTTPEQLEASIKRAEEKANAVLATNPPQAYAIRTQIRRMDRELGELRREGGSHATQT